MSLSTDPSPLPTGGWTTRGLTERGATPNSGLYAGMNGYSSSDDQWAAAKARSAQVRGYPSIQTKNEGFFQRSKRKISSTLPVFSPYTPLSANWKDPEKLGRSRWSPRGGGSLAKIKTFVGNVLRKFKFLFIILSLVVGITLVMSHTSKCFG
jgi:mannan polymerase II complex MNN10 subunit